MLLFTGSGSLLLGNFPVDSWPGPEEFCMTLEKAQRADAATPSRRYSHSCRLFLTTSGRGSKTLNPARVSSLDECRTFHRCWSLGRVQTPRLSCLAGALIELQGAGEQLVGVERLTKQNCCPFDEEVRSLRPLPSSASRS